MTCDEKLNESPQVRAQTVPVLHSWPSRTMFGMIILAVIDNGPAPSFS